MCTSVILPPRYTATPFAHRAAKQLLSALITTSPLTGLTMMDAVKIAEQKYSITTKWKKP
jgi:hypothetical protein